MRRAGAEIANAVSSVLRGLPLCAPVLLLEAPPTLAQSVASHALSVDIPAQPLAQALAAFASQSRLQIVYVSEILANKRSHAVSAGLSANETLTRLLKGTGLASQPQVGRGRRAVPGHRHRQPPRGVRSGRADYDPGHHR